MPEIEHPMQDIFELLRRALTVLSVIRLKLDESAYFLLRNTEDGIHIKVYADEEASATFPEEVINDQVGKEWHCKSGEELAQSFTEQRIATFLRRAGKDLSDPKILSTNIES